MKAWHFLHNDKRLRWGTKEVVEIGKTYTAQGNIATCKNGMHASVQAIDALKYAPGPIVCRVELTGDIKSDEDKMVARSRKVLAMADATETLRCFSRSCALSVAHLWNPPEVVMDFLVSGQNRAAARAAAWDAAWDAARDAAWAAAWDAAGAAARDAARDAAWDAAGAAERAAVWYAAEAAATKEQNAVLESYLEELLGSGL